MAGFMFQGKQGELKTGGSEEKTEEGEEEWRAVYSLDTTNFIFFTLLPGQSTLPGFFIYGQHFQ